MPIDSFIGRHVPRLPRAAGLVEVQAQPRIHVYPPGHGRRMLHVQLSENLRECLVTERLLADVEFDELLAAVKRHLADSATLVVSPLYFQVWGRKPVR